MSALPRGWGECYVNQAILSTLLRSRWKAGGAYHCTGVTRCLKKIEGKKHRDNDKVILLIDYEYNESVRSLIREKLSRHQCVRACEGRVVEAYECMGGDVLILLLREPPEDLIRAQVPGKHTKKLEYKALKGEFKSRAKRYTGGLDCVGRDWVEELLCKLYNLIIKDLGACTRLTPTQARKGREMKRDLGA